MMCILDGEMYLKLGMIEFLGQNVNLDDVFETLDESKKSEIIKKTKEKDGLHFEYSTKSNIVKINGIILTATEIFGSEKANVLERVFNENCSLERTTLEAEKKEKELIQQESEKLKNLHVSFNGKLFYMGDDRCLTECKYHILSECDRKIILAEKYKPDMQKTQTRYEQVAYCYGKKDDYRSRLFDDVFVPASNLNGHFSVTKLVDMASHDDITQILADPTRDERSFNGTDFILNGVTFPKSEQDAYNLDFL